MVRIDFSKNTGLFMVRIDFSKNTGLFMVRIDFSKNTYMLKLWENWGKSYKSVLSLLSQFYGGTY